MTIASNAAMNIGLRASFQIFLFLHVYLGVELLDHIIVLFLAF